MNQLIPVYTFDASAKTITFNDFSSIQLERVLMITNVTDNITIYNLVSLGGTVSGNVLTLDYDTTGMEDTDELFIKYDTAQGDPDYARVTNVETENHTLREDFAGSAIDASQWTYTAGGNAPAPTVTNSLLTMGSGTTAGAVTTLRSVDTFTMPSRIQFAVSISQRIANQTLYLEMTSADGTTHVAWAFDGTTATSQKIVAQNAGNKGTADTAVTTTATTGTLAVFELDCRADGIDYTERASESNAVGTSRATRVRTILRPGVEYHIQLRWVNGGVAPATNTNVVVEYIMVQDSTKLVAEIAGGRGNNVASRSVPVTVNNTVPVTMTSTLNNIPSTSATTSPALTVTNVLFPTAASANYTLVKNAVGKLTGWSLTNRAATWRYIKFISKATAPVAGETAIFQIALAPAGQDGSHQTMPSLHGRQFALGIGMWISENPALNDHTVTNIVANDVVGHLETV